MNVMAMLFLDKKQHNCIMFRHEIQYACLVWVKFSHPYSWAWVGLGSDSVILQILSFLTPNPITVS